MFFFDLKLFPQITNSESIEYNNKLSLISYIKGKKLV